MRTVTEPALSDALAGQASIFPQAQPGIKVPGSSTRRVVPKSSPGENRRYGGRTREGNEPLAGQFLSKPYTVELLIANERVVSLVAEFLDLNESDVGWNRKGRAFVFGPSYSRDDRRNNVWTFAEVRAQRETGKWRKLTSSQNAVWGKRLFIETGLLDPAPTESAPSDYVYAPAGRSLSRTQRVLARFRLLLGISGRPSVAFTGPFAADWCGIGRRQAYEAICSLERQRRIEQDGAHGRARLWRLK